MSSAKSKSVTILASAPDISDEDEEIAPILEGLDIKVGPFSQEEYEKAKKYVSGGRKKLWRRPHST